MCFACIYNSDFTLMSAEYFSHFMWLSHREHISVCLWIEVPFFVFLFCFFKAGQLLLSFLVFQRRKSVYFRDVDSHIYLPTCWQTPKCLFPCSWFLSPVCAQPIHRACKNTNWHKPPLSPSLGHVKKLRRITTSLNICSTSAHQPRI